MTTPMPEQLDKFCTCDDCKPMECEGCRVNRERRAATSAKPVQTYTGDDLAMAYKDGYAAGGVSMAQGDAKDAEITILENTQIIRDIGGNLSQNGWKWDGQKLQESALAIERAAITNKKSVL